MDITTARNLYYAHQADHVARINDAGDLETLVAIAPETVKHLILFTNTKMLAKCIDKLHLFANLNILHIRDHNYGALLMSEESLRRILINCPRLEYLIPLHCEIKPDGRPLPATNLKCLAINHIREISHKLIRGAPLQCLLVYAKNYYADAMNDLADSIRLCSTLKSLYVVDPYNFYNNHNIIAAIYPLQEVNVQPGTALNAIPHMYNLQKIAIIFEPNYQYNRADDITRILTLLSQRTILTSIEIQYETELPYANHSLLDAVAINNPNLTKLIISWTPQSAIVSKNTYGPWCIETHHKFPLLFRLQVRELLKQTIDIINDDMLYLLLATLWEQIRIDHSLPN